MNTATLKPVILLCALLPVYALAAEQSPPAEHPHSKCPHHTSHGELTAMRERMQQLGLSELQKQELGTLVGIYEPRLREIVARGHADREALLLAVPGSADYNSLTGKVSQEAAASAGEMVVLLAELQANAYALLTDEQQAQYLELKEEARAKAAEKAAAKRAARKASSGTDYSHKAHRGYAQSPAVP